MYNIDVPLMSRARAMFFFYFNIILYAIIILALLNFSKIPFRNLYFPLIFDYRSNLNLVFSQNPLITFHFGKYDLFSVAPFRIP